VYVGSISCVRVCTSFKICFLEGLKEVWGIVVCKEDRDKANKSINALEVEFDAITDAP
jgi:hypothetical protein